MGVVLWVILGLIAGVLALFVMYRTVPRDPTGWLGALVIGLIGGLLGGWIADLIGLEAANWVGSIVIAFAGALVVLWLLKRTTGRRL